MWDLVPSTGIKPEPPALGAWSLSHWATRKLPVLVIFMEHGEFPATRYIKAHKDGLFIRIVVEKELMQNFR